MQVAGLWERDWWDIWQHCYVPGMAGMVRQAWPDGGGWQDQPAITVAMFDLIAEQVYLEAEQVRQRSG